VNGPSLLAVGMLSPLDPQGPQIQTPFHEDQETSEVEDSSGQAQGIEGQEEGVLILDDSKRILELQAGLKERDKRLSSLDGQLEGYTGPFWKSKIEGSTPGGYNPENHVYEYISYVVPQLAYSNPRVAIKSRVYGAEEEMTLMRYLMNSWVADNGYGEFLDAPAHDVCFSWAVLLTTLEDHPYLETEEGSGEWAKVVKAHRLSQRDYVRDPDSYTKEEARWEGHAWEMDREDLIRLAKESPEEGWDLAVIKDLGNTEETNTEKKKVTDRDVIRCYDMWWKNEVLEAEEGEEPLTQENGFHGVIHTYAACDSDDGVTMVEVRNPRAFYGPPWGMYSFGSIHYVPDDTWGLSPLIAVEGQIRDLNMHARNTSKRAARRKRPVFVDESMEGALAEKLQDARDDEVIGIAGFDSSKIYGTEIGGITDQDLTYGELARNRLERVSGLTEQQRGQAGAADSATEAAIAKEGGDIRLEYTKLQFQRLVRKQLKTVAWYYHHDEDTRHVVSPEAAEELGIPLLPGQSLTIEGGNPRIPFDLLGIEIEPLSMERTTTASQQRKGQELVQTVISIGQAMLQMPYIQWGDLLDIVGESHNVPRMGELFNMETLSQFVQIQQELGQANPQAQISQNAQPKSSQGLNQSPANQVISQSPFNGFSEGQTNKQQTIGAK